MGTSKISKWAWSSISFSIIATIMLVLAGYGYQWGWWGLGTAFTWLIPGSAVLGLISFSLAVIFGFVRWRDNTRAGTKTAISGLILGVAVMSFVGYWYNEAQQYPPIHDISTDIDNLPEFRAIVPLRTDAPNDTTYGDKEKAKVQRKNYPDVQTLYLDMEYDKAYARALEAAKQMPWEQIVAASKNTGRIEAVDELAWFGFKDDVVIRVDTASVKRSTIDVRSVSRIGKGDIGVNAHRIRNYLKEVQNDAS